MKNCQHERMVDVCEYPRIRFGNLERVRRHKRRFPQRRRGRRGR
jgi:hypothetical protein